MTQIETTQKTFGKKTIKTLISKVSGIVKFVKVKDSFLAKNKEDKTLAVWMPRSAAKIGL